MQMFGTTYAYSGTRNQASRRYALKLYVHTVKKPGDHGCLPWARARKPTRATSSAF